MLEKRKKLRAEFIAKLDAKEQITISEAIISQRKILGLTQEELSKRSGIALGTIKALEGQKGNPTLGAAQKILEVLGDLRIYVGRQPES